jgi:hypothetical protein
LQITADYGGAEQSVDAKSNIGGEAGDERDVKTQTSGREQESNTTSGGKCPVTATYHGQLNKQRSNYQEEPPQTVKQHK